MGLQALRGTADLLAEELARWNAIEQTARGLAKRYGYQEIRTPIIEESSLFLRSVGETSNIVQKEMFRFTDRGGHDIVLRPEATAAVVRAYLQHNLHKTQGFTKLCYIGPMFRAERPQAGRFRQFHQFGVEAIGSSSPWVDAEVIALCVETLKACGLRSPLLWLSSMGCRTDQAASARALRERLKSHRKELCEDCQSRFDKNIFRVLDCNHQTCHQLAWKANQSPFVLCKECQEHFDHVRKALETIGIAFDDTKVFARGLDYYTRTVFEVRASGLGAQDAVAAGGRYDHLVEELGGPATGAVGFAAGIERLILAIRPSESSANSGREGLYVAVAKPQLLVEAFRLVQTLRQQGLSASMDYEGRSLKAQLREADKLRCHWVAILGETELREGKISIKDLEQGQQQEVALDRFVEEMARQATSITSA